MTPARNVSAVVPVPLLTTTSTPLSVLTSYCHQARKLTPITIKPIADRSSDSGSSNGAMSEPITHTEVSPPVKKKLDKGIGIGKVILTPTRPFTSKDLRRSTKDEDTRSPKRQRTTRHRGYKSLNYDVRYHPMDDFTRPSHATRVKAQGRKATEDDEDTSPPIQNSEASDDNTDDSFKASQGADMDDDEEDDEGDVRLPPQPSPNRRRSSRTSGRGEVNYDMKVHPSYDKVLRPAVFEAATRRKSREQKARRQSTDTTSTLLDDEAAAQDLKIDEVEKQRPKPTPKLSFSTIQSIAIPPLPIRSINRSKSRVTAKDSSKTRSRPSKSTPPVKGKTGSKSASPAEADAFIGSPNVMALTPLRDVSPSTPPKGRSSRPAPPSRSKSLSQLIIQMPLDFEKLSNFERRLYNVQAGAPLNGRTLPLAWTHVKQILFDHGQITLDDLNSANGTDWIKARYEEVRLRVEAFFSAPAEPADNKDWILLRSEAFDVFDKRSGSKYWKHYRDSVVCPTSIKDSIFELQPHEIAETESEEESDSGEGWDAASVHGDTDESESKPSETSSDMDIELPIFGLGDEMDGIDDDPDQALVETMRDNFLSSDSSNPMTGTDELGDLLSPIVQYLDEDKNKPDTAMDIVLSDRKSSGSARSHAASAHHYTPRLVDAEAYDTTRIVTPNPPSRLQGAFQFKSSERTLVGDVNDEHASNWTDVLQASATELGVRKRRLRTGNEVAVHEDPQGRSPEVERLVALNPISPRTDLPKENLENESRVEISSDVDLRTPRARRHRQAASAPGSRRAARIMGAAGTTPRRSLFGGPSGQISPST